MDLQNLENLENFMDSYRTKIQVIKTNFKKLVPHIYKRDEGVNKFLQQSLKQNFF